jgi:hypothetical protein
MPNTQPTEVTRIYPGRPTPVLTVTARKQDGYSAPTAVPNADPKRSRVVEPPSQTRLYGAGQRIANAERLERERRS